ncbi:hypothetical protein DFH08DRAFT_801627 [Mycena albidolilacea]|uniref:Uncharacterized protein n=1 Tax=Mycena albidolilacea TaxID=1033008 RepID=A0AAD7F159_9AGAR|nr:hypothetical protein DFH08DRAFT_801627 [Mycena albidolilacea]
MQGGVDAAISALAALAPHLPALSQRHSTPADVNREISRSPALLAAPIRRRRIRQRFGVTLVHTRTHQQWRRHRDKPPPQVHGTLDGALAAARLAQRHEGETHRIGWGTVARRVGGEYMLQKGKKRKDLTPKIIRRANGRIPEATVPIECTELVEILTRFGHARGSIRRRPPEIVWWVKCALEENECRAVRRGDQERGLDGRKSRRKPRDVTLVTPGSVAETSGRALDGRLTFGNLRPALASNSEETEFFKIINQTLNTGPNWHAHTKKALKMTNFAEYSTSEGIYETPNIWPDGGACSRGESRKGEKRGHRTRLRKGCNRRGKYKDGPVQEGCRVGGKHGEQVCGQRGSSAWMAGIERADDRERARGRQALNAHGVWDRAAGDRQRGRRVSSTHGMRNERAGGEDQERGQ